VTETESLTPDGTPVTRYRVSIPDKTHSEVGSNDDSYLSFGVWMQADAFRAAPVRRDVRLTNFVHGTPWTKAEVQAVTGLAHSIHKVKVEGTAYHGVIEDSDVSLKADFDRRTIEGVVQLLGQGRYIHTPRTEAGGRLADPEGNFHGPSGQALDKAALSELREDIRARLPNRLLLDASFLRDDGSHSGRVRQFNSDVPGTNHIRYDQTLGGYTAKYYDGDKSDQPGYVGGTFDIEHRGAEVHGAFGARKE